MDLGFYSASAISGLYEEIFLYFGSGLEGKCSSDEKKQGSSFTFRWGLLKKHCG